MPRSMRAFANSFVFIPSNGRLMPGGASTMSPMKSTTTSIWMGGSGLPVSSAFTSITSPILIPRKVMGAPGLSPRTEPGK